VQVLKCELRKNKSSLTPDGKHYIFKRTKNVDPVVVLQISILCFARKLMMMKFKLPFIVEKIFGGISFRRKRHKMGIKEFKLTWVFF